MTDAERRLIDRVRRKTENLTPVMVTLLLRAYRAIADALPESAITDLIAARMIDAVVTRILSDRTLTLAFRRVQSQLRTAVDQSISYVARELPKGGVVNGQLAVMFDHLNPNVLGALVELDAKILPSLKAGVRESVRQAIIAGLDAGQNPRTIARGLRDVIGLAPWQDVAVRNYRAELEAGQIAAAESRVLHDARFTVTDNMSAAKIDRMVTVYRNNMAASHAETVARTAMLDAYRKGQDLSWRQAIDAGIVDGDRLMKTWVQIQRPTRRESHGPPLDGETVPFDEPYSNGDMIPGEAQDEWNCGCQSRVFVARAA